MHAESVNRLLDIHALGRFRLHREGEHRARFGCKTWVTFVIFPTSCSHHHDKVAASDAHGCSFTVLVQIFWRWTDIRIISFFVAPADRSLLCGRGCHFVWLGRASQEFVFEQFDFMAFSW